MKGVIDDGRNAVRGLRTPPAVVDDLEGTVSRIRDELAADTADFRVIVAGRPKPVNPMVRDEIYRIGREGLIDAFRHAKASAIEESNWSYWLRELRLFVRDDGCGIAPEVVRLGSDGHWGIAGCASTRRVGATLQMRSRHGAGTEVELRVPRDNA